MNVYRSGTALSVLTYAVITMAATILILEMYGVAIIKYQMSHSMLIMFFSGLKYSGFPQWDGLLPLTTFLICLTGGLCCAWLCGMFIKAWEAAVCTLYSLFSRGLRALKVRS